MASSHSWRGQRVCWDVFAKVGFKCLLAATIGRCELERDGKREVVVKAGLTAKPWGCIPVSVRECGLGVNFCLFREYVFIIQGEGKDGRIEGMP